VHWVPQGPRELEGTQEAQALLEVRDRQVFQVELVHQVQQDHPVLKVSRDLLEILELQAVRVNQEQQGFRDPLDLMEMLVQQDRLDHKDQVEALDL